MRKRTRRNAIEIGTTESRTEGLATAIPPTALSEHRMVRWEKEQSKKEAKKAHETTETAGVRTLQEKEASIEVSDWEVRGGEIELRLTHLRARARFQREPRPSTAISICEASSIPS